MDGSSDTLALWPGQSENLTQWKYSLASYYPEQDMADEWWRHNQRCDTLWVGGNVSSIRYSFTGDTVDFRWYTGDAPVINPAF